MVTVCHTRLINAFDTNTVGNCRQKLAKENLKLRVMIAGEGHTQYDKNLVPREYEDLRARHLANQIFSLNGPVAQSTRCP